ncbi:transcription elongation factor GreA [Malaciobacter halophilus]|uniref:Transcription elongation factor GreA n=1 Tax=Malaciobacter halophilus TaxID=197482 RepID=A0A2N1J6R2_9BACT|nr:GreA/GreB family elongation factor [Malaciobacter halophilus]AXH10034.1 transcription elongation factor GreB [Malaciobacter halophilus]PKI82246.1 transcription elongation factor GreA [Malaciobacter halophilus]
MKKELITQVGFRSFLYEFNKLLKIEKPYWVKQKEIAAQFGDRSENAEYISAKEQLRNIDKRLRFLDKIIKTTEVINIDKIPHNKVNFGSQVTLLNLDTQEEKKYVIVGTYETNPSENFISNKSPLGKTLLNRSLNEEFEFKINENYFFYEVINIKKYEFKEN